MCNLFGQFRFVAKLPYAVEFRLKRRQAKGVDALFIHASRVVIADLAGHAIAPGVWLGGLLQDPAQGLPVALFQLVEAPPAPLIGGNGIGLQPVAASVLVEILAGIGGFIDGLDVETDHGRVGRRWLGERGARAHEGEKPDFRQAGTPWFDPTILRLRRSGKESAWATPGYAAVASGCMMPKIWPSGSLQ